MGQKPKQQVQLSKPREDPPTVHNPREDAAPPPSVTKSNTFSHQAASMAVKEREKFILKMINQKQESLWKEFQARKHADEEFWNAQAVPQSEKELAHISKLLGVNPVQQPKPPDFVIDEAVGGDGENEHHSSVERSEKQSSQNA
ncbi:hypothetical protein RIF29_06773 [Crotalaria pallida]|uniref:Uncharacterized protein n=1 Tax=Crotalaria pallida TaxID=3830 RepID=A0AAN9PBH2_CROPI